MTTNIELTQTDFVCEKEFNDVIKRLNARQDKEKPLWTRERIEETITAIEQFKLAPILKVKRTNKQYYYGKKYDVIEIGATKSLILKRKSATDPVVIIVSIEEFYHILRETHQVTGHGGRDKMLYSLKSRFFIPTSVILEFLKLCTVCQSKRKNIRKSNVVPPIVSANFNHRGQVDLIDFQSTAYGDYKWLLHYQDLATKFIFLRPLTSKRPAEVAMELLKIFLEVGCPYVLQGDNGREFTGAIIQELACLWPTCKVLNGRPNPESQETVEISNKDVEDLLRAWLLNNNANNWTIGCYFVQFQKNSILNRNMQRSPFKALFGTEPSTGLQSAHISKELLEQLTTEEDLEKLYEEKNAEDTPEASDNLQSAQLLGNDDTTTSNLADLPLTESIKQLKSNHDFSTPIPYSKTNLLLIEPKIEAVHSQEKRQRVCCNEYTRANTSDVYKESEHVICGNNKRKEGHELENLNKTAEMIADSSVIKIKEELVDSAVWVDVPMSDSSPCDRNNTVRIDLDNNKYLYQIGTSGGSNIDWLPTNTLQIDTTTFTKTVPGIELSSQDVAGKISSFGGQGLKKCLCEESKVQCRTNRCACKKNNVPCNFKCHKSTTCFNK